jgi:acyl-CoA thioester hydrolase
MQFSESGWDEGWFVVPHEVEWRDIDGVGHVNNVTYFSYFEVARTRYWHVLTGDTSIRELKFIVARAECNFRLQLEIAQRIRIGVRIGEMRNSSFDFLYEIRTEHGRELAADGKVVVVHFSWDENRKTPITDDLREKINTFQKG